MVELHSLERWGPSCRAPDRPWIDPASLDVAKLRFAALLVRFLGWDAYRVVAVARPSTSGLLTPQRRTGKRARARSGRRRR
jgi:hypothetical protein